VADRGLAGRLFLDTRRRLRVPQERKLEREGRAAPRAFRFGADCAAVQLDQVSHYREAEPESAVRARRGLVALPEAVEDVREEVGANPRARVRDEDARVRAVRV